LSSGGNSGGAVFPNGNTMFVLASTNFTNITVRGDGGAIFDEFTGSHSIASCVFQDCTSTYGRGGAIFINVVNLPAISNCRFFNNNAYSQGQDIGHYSDSCYGLYSTIVLSGTCSNSESPRISFPNGNNVDNLLLGIPPFFFIYYFLFFLFFVYVP
jgi:hypothetical protein